MNRRIILVEDNPADIELVRTAFEESGHAVDFTVFNDGDEAMEGIVSMLSAGLSPRLILLDLNLPRASGHEVLQAIRSHPAGSGIPVVVFSTSNHPSDVRRCLAAGADDYVVKPPHFAQLLEIAGRLHHRWLEPSDEIRPGA